MRFLANENFPFPSIEILRNKGFELSSISESYPGISDAEVISLAKKTISIILTFDKDYGEIIFKSGIDNPPAVIFFRFKGNYPESAAEILISLFDNKTLSFENTFTVIEFDGVRQKKYEV
ncbi:MAG: hypothetical protein E6Q96_02255 [Cyclobacteriaceae bacterium]|nr:MAG: hypothetical protein E6Q96_02255 [Cyclobacteriaceae bacterium]